MLSLSVYFICFPVYILTIVKYCLLLPAVNITGNLIRNYVVFLEATTVSTVMSAATVVACQIEFFTFNTKLPIKAMLTSKSFAAAKRSYLQWSST